MQMPEYDSQRQISLVNGVQVPLMKGTIVPGKWKWKPKWIGGEWVLDTFQDISYD
jgi:hypothetical protein